MSRLLRPLAGGAILLAVAVVAHAGSWVARFNEVRPKAQEVCKSHDLPACEQALLELERLLDGRVDIEYRLARVEAELGHNESALRRLEIYARSGLDLGNPAEQAAFATLNKSGSLRHILELYRAGLVTNTTHVPVANLADTNLVAEDIACERQHGSFLISSVRERKILRVESSGKINDFVTQARAPLWGVLALGLDPPRNLLWATIWPAPISPPVRSDEAERSAVLALDARSGAILSRYELPAEHGVQHSFGDLTVSPTGTVYVSDGLGGGVYSVTHADDSRLTTLVEPGQIESPQTPALTADGSRLLVPDYTRGIAVVDLKTKALRWLGHPPELAIFGIDGFYLQGQILIAIQNGTEPERIVMMHLTDGLDRIDRWRVLLARAPGLGDPTHGCLRDGEFYFIANSGWDQFQDNGDPRPNTQPTAPQIWKIPVPAT